MHDLLAHLTPAQREAAEHVEGPLLILAGPGSGKTRVVTHRIAWLIHQGVSPRHVVALTFTNKAAEEMLARVERLVPGANVWTSTFHRFCARLLRRYAELVGLEPNFTIYDTDDSRRTLRRVMAEMKEDWSLVTPERLAGEISRAKNNLVPPEEYGRQPTTPLAFLTAQVYPAYQRALLNANAVDFDDLLMHVARLVREQPEIRRGLDQRYRYILVDEYQDTNLAQYAIVRALSIDEPNLAVTGDPDQSIYGWRGANVRNILEFERDFPDTRVVRLEQNYRSTGNILRVADVLIAHNRRRKPKALYTENEAGPPVCLTTYASHEQEAHGIAARIAEQVRSGRRRPRDFAIFYRVNALSRALETALRFQGIPYQLIHSVEFYQRQEIKDVLAYLQLINNPRNTVALLRVINTPPRGIGKKTIQRLSRYAAERDISLLDAARESGLIEDLPKRGAVAVARFVALYDRLSLVAHAPVEEIVGHVLSETGYMKRLENSEAPEDQDRLANIKELLTGAREFDRQHPDDGGLEAFLEQASLVNDTDAWEGTTDCVTLMTLHAAKGLEFPVVFIVALEQGVLPHQRVIDTDGDVEEERRLLFVGLTRAQQELYLSHATYRDFAGRSGMTVPSEFLGEMPRDEMHYEQQAANGGSPVLQSCDEHSDAHRWEAEMSRDARRGRSARRRPGVQATGLPLTTAAELAGSEARFPAGRLSPDLFFHGMRVRHPDYGLGTIVALSHEGTFRGATVEFDDAAVGQRRFVLAHSPLEPASDV